jgi:hypothetical protein
MAPSAMYDGVEIDAPCHKRISDVLTVGAAVTAGKSSKQHKMKPRSEKRDRTKSKESKTFAIRQRRAHTGDEVYDEC